MTMWSTKYALTKGIEAVENATNHEGSQFWYWDGPPGSYTHIQYVFGTNLFSNREDAVITADRIRVKKIAALKKQITALEDMRFA